MSQYTVSAGGTLIYTVGGGSTGDRKLVWLDRDGREHETAAPVGLLGAIGGYDLSPDGRQIVASDGLEAGNLWLLEFDRGIRTRFTFEDEADQSPVWSTEVPGSPTGHSADAA